MNRWQKTLVPGTNSILETIGVIDREGLQIALVVDPAGRLLGTVTDGDIRRGLLNGKGLESSVTEVMNAKPLTASETTPKKEIIRRMREKKLRHLPLVDGQGRVCKLEVWENLLVPEKRPNSIVLMAGGEGTRLRPLTQDCPKPLLRVGGRPILETIVSQLSSYGFENIYIAVHYKAEMIREHFGDGAKWGVSIRYLEEDTQMGTAGALGLLPRSSPEPIIVMNGDLLTKMNFEQMLQFHSEQNAVATMAIREFDFRVPYGVVRLEGERLLSIDEKPLQKFFVNAGMYVLNPEILDLLPKRQRFDMPDFFRIAMQREQKVAAFPIREYWLDIGKPDDFERANFDFLSVFADHADGSGSE